MLDEKECWKDHELRIRELETALSGLKEVNKVILSVTGASLVLEGLIFLAVLLH